MKKILIALSFFSTVSLFGQSAFTKTNHHLNGTETYFVCDSLISNFADITGSGVTWNYDTIQKKGVSGTIVIANNDGTEDSVFTPSDRNINTNNFTTEYIVTSVDTVFRKGISINNPGFGAVNAYFNPMPKAMIYDLAFLDSVVSVFSGGANVTDIGLTAVPMWGSHKSKYDGYGTLKIGNTTVHDVSRIFSYDSIKVDTQDPGVGIIDVILFSIEYYDLTSSSSPIFIKQAYQIIMGEQSAEFVTVLSKYDPSVTQTIGVKSVSSDIKFNIAPNPAQNNIKLNGDFECVDIQIINTLGEVVYTGSALNNSTVSIADLTAGVYILKTTVNKQVVTRKIIKN